MNKKSGVLSFFVLLVEFYATNDKWQKSELEDGCVDPYGSIPFHGAIAIAFKGYNYDRNEVLNMISIFKESSHGINGTCYNLLCY